MKVKSSDWYKNIWTLDIKNESWVEDTENQVNIRSCLFTMFIYGLGLCKFVNY